MSKRRNTPIPALFHFLSRILAAYFQVILKRISIFCQARFCAKKDGERLLPVYVVFVLFLLFDADRALEGLVEVFDLGGKVSE